LTKIQLAYKTVNSRSVFSLKCRWITNYASTRAYQQYLVQVTNAYY